MNDNFEKFKEKLIAYFKGVRTEWGKITWPERQQVVVETFFVIAIVIIFTVFLFGVDQVFIHLFDKLDKFKA